MSTMPHQDLRAQFEEALQELKQCASKYGCQVAQELGARMHPLRRQDHMISMVTRWANPLDQLKVAAAKFNTIGSTLLRSEMNYAREVTLEFNEKSAKMDQVQAEEQQVVYALEHEHDEVKRLNLARKYVDLVALLEGARRNKMDALGEMMAAKQQVNQVKRELNQWKGLAITAEKSHMCWDVVSSQPMNGNGNQATDSVAGDSLQSILDDLSSIANHQASINSKSIETSKYNQDDQNKREALHEEYKVVPLESELKKEQKHDYLISSTNELEFQQEAIQTIGENGVEERRLYLPVWLLLALFIYVAMYWRTSPSLASKCSSNDSSTNSLNNGTSRFQWLDQCCASMQWFVDLVLLLAIGTLTFLVVRSYQMHFEYGTEMQDQSVNDAK